MGALSRVLPIAGWLPNYPKEVLRKDLGAGVTTAVVLVPQAMAYAMLAGLSPIAGLYAALVAPVAYAVFGTSRQLAVGPVAMDSLLTAAAVGAIAQTGTADYASAAILLALMVGALQVVLGALRAGFVVNFLSRPVISGFTSAAALIIATSQLGEAVGLKLTGSAYVHEIWFSALSQVSRWHLPTLLMAAASLVVLRLLPKLTTKVPASLVAVVAATLAFALLGLDTQGVRSVGSVPSGLPSLVPLHLDLALVRTLLPSALTLALVSYMETITTGTAFARKHQYEIVPNQELIAVGAANLSSGIFGGYVVAGGLSRSAVNDKSGAQTGLSGIVTAAVVALSLLVLTPLFRDLPRAALSAVILSAVVTLIDVKTPRQLYRIKRNDFWLLVATFFATLWLGISQGILFGVGLSLALFIVRTTRPHYAVLGHVPGTQAYLNVGRHPNVEAFEGVLIVRMDAQLYFGNVSFLRETLRKLEREAKGKLKAVVLDASGVNQLDSSALEALEDLDRDYAARGVRLIYARVKGPVRDVMQRAGMLELLRREQRIFTRTHDAVECAERYASALSGPCEVACGDLSAGVDPGVERPNERP